MLGDREGDDCPGEEEVAAYVGGHLAPAATRGLEAHVARCVACRQLLSALAQDAAAAPSTFDSRSPTLMPAAAERDRELLPAGARFGRYVVLDWRGTGGMGVVYAAHDPELRRNVALKVLRSEPELADTLPTAIGARATDDGAARRDLLLREAQAMAQLAHPNVVRVFDVGSVDGNVFLAMELIDGQTLRQWLAAPQPPHAILAAFIAAGHGLAAAHAAGMVHRDFKPDNVLVGDDGRICVTDFGLARPADEADPAALGAEPRATTAGACPRPAALPDGSAGSTTAGAMAGTPAYMAPEQARGQRPDARADQFSFAVALYEALYGVRPFASLDDAVAGRCRPPIASAPIPSRVRPVLLRALRADPEARFAAMPALLAALAPPARSRRGVWAGGTAAVAIAVAALGYASLRGEAPQRDPGSAELASRWRDLAPALRAQMQSAHMLPIHDIRPARDAVRAQLREVEHQLETPAGRDQRALGQFVLGEGWRALGEPRRALAALELAWDAGERGPHLDEALGTALGAVYDLELAVVERTVAPRDREARLHALATRYREPAMAHLRAALVARRGSPAYLEALLAFHDQRFVDAAERAHTVFAATPTAYDAGVLEARAHSERGRTLLGAALFDDAKREFAAARATLDRVLEIARSDDEAWLVAGNLRYEEANALSRDGVVPVDLQNASIAAVRNVQHINPDNGDAYLREARIYLGQGNLEVLWGRDPSAQVDRLLPLLELARHHGSDVASIEAYLCDAEWERGHYQASHGVDPRPAFARSIAACNRSIAERPDADTYSSLAGALATSATYDGDHGGDPMPTFARADAANLAAIAIMEDPGLHHNRARLGVRIAHYQVDHDGDPETGIALALSEFRTVTRVTVTRADSWAGVVDALSMRAQYRAAHGGELTETVAEARDALRRVFEIDRYLPALRYRLALSDAEARAALARHADPSAAIAQMRDDAGQLAGRYPGDEYVHRMASRAALWAARWALAQHAPAVDEPLDHAADEARHARDANPNEARAWLVSAEVELTRAEAGDSAATARGRAFNDRALEIDPRLGPALRLRDRLARAADPPARDAARAGRR